MEPGKLMLATKELLLNDNRELVDIAYNTGISIYLLQKIKSGQAQNCSVNTIEKLYEFLSGDKIL